MPLKILPQAELKALFDYCSDTGVLTWRTRPIQHFKADHDCRSWNTKFSGKEAGCPNGYGYLVVGIGDKLFMVHRIIYKWLSGTDPAEIDHINGVREDNRAGNLREVTRKINCQNQKIRCTNKSGVMGVSWHNPSRKWRANIVVDGKQIHLGYFKEIEDATEARQAADIKHGYHSNHGRII